MSKIVSNATGTPKNTLAGLGKYFRFTLRHNWVRYLVWIAVTVGLLAYVIVFYQEQMKTDSKFLDQFASIAQAGGMSAMIGKITVTSLAGAVWSKIWMTLAMTLGIGMVFQVTRGTRADEENGRTELFRSRPFGIHSTLLSVVTGALLLSFVIGVLTTLVCIGLNLDPTGSGVTGSITFGLSLIGIGWFGVGVGALSNQLSASGSLANATGSIIIVAFYVIRMIGDLGNSAISWFSPIGWGENMAPWADNRWWLIFPFIVLTALLIPVALIIESRRDYGSGVLKDKKGKAAANPIMRHSWGLVLHLYKGPIIAWTVGMALAGLMFGSVAKSMVDLFKDMTFKMGLPNGADPVQNLIGLLLCFIGLVAVVLPMQIMTGLRSDEAKGLTEAQLAGGISRARLVLERYTIAVCSTVLLLLLGGIAFGASYGSVVSDMSQTWRIALDALIYLPGIMAISGLVALLFGFVPRFTIPVTWFVYAAMYFAVLIGDALKLPDWVFNIIPFTGTPKIPAVEFNWGVLGYVAAAVVFVALGIISLCKRDVPR